MRLKRIDILELLLIFAALASLSCSSGTGRPRRVIIFGVDAADWGVMSDLLEDGKLPNFTRLTQEGATGRLETLMPLMKSPILWTSIATGVLPEKHGIGGFVTVVADGDTVPYTRNVRRVKTIWNILGENDLSVAVVGWMVTWPAEQVNGYLVTDYLQYETEARVRLDKQTYPPGLFAEVDHLRLNPVDVSDQTIEPIYHIVGPPENLGGKPWQKNYVKTIYAMDETFRRIAFYLNDNDPNFLAVYFNGIDSMGHCFWHYRKETGNPLSKIIDNYYVWMDEVLGQFMDLVDDETLLIVCSDHGFYGPRRMADGGLLLGVHMHGEHGLIGFMGKGVRKGGEIMDADILDVAPTVLYAFGLGVARDMDGRVLTDAFEFDFLEQHPVSFVSTYETGESQGGDPISTPFDGKIKERLRTVGYLQ